MRRWLPGVAFAALCVLVCGLALSGFDPGDPSAERVVRSLDRVGTDAWAGFTTSARVRLDDWRAAIPFTWVAVVFVPAALSPLMFRGAANDDARASGRRHDRRG